MTNPPNLEELAASIPPRGPWWWFSFVDPDADKFLGACLVRGATAKEALLRAHLLNINPGGEPAFRPLPAGLTPPEAYCNRLLTKEDADQLSEEWPPVPEGDTH